MSDVVAVGQLRAFVERVERLEEEIKTLNDDKSEVYKEMRGFGFDVKAVRKVVAKRKLDPSVASEQDAVFDLYWDALTGASHVHVHTHVENIEEFPVNSYAQAKLVETVAAGMQTETGRKALIAAVDIMIEREEQIEPDTGEIKESLADRPSDAVSERTAPLVDATASAEAVIEGQPSGTAATSAESAGEAVLADLPTNFEPPAFLQPKPVKTARDYRPHCQKPDECGASGLQHCYSCSKIVPEKSEVA